MDRMLNDDRSNHYQNLMNALEKWDDEESILVLAKFAMLQDNDVKGVSIITEKSMISGFIQPFSLLQHLLTVVYL